MLLGSGQASSPGVTPPPSQGAPLHPRLHLVAPLPGHQCRPLHLALLPHHPGHHHHHYGQVQRHQACGVPQRKAHTPTLHIVHQDTDPRPPMPPSQGHVRGVEPVSLLPSQALVLLFQPSPAEKVPHHRGLQTRSVLFPWAPCHLSLGEASLGSHSPRGAPQEESAWVHP